MPLLCTLALFFAIPLSKGAPDRPPPPQNYIYFGLERSRTSDPGFLSTPSIVGAQLKYDRIGVGVGGPDLLPHRWFQRQNSLPLIARRAPETVAGVAVQRGNLEDTKRETGERVTVEELGHPGAVLVRRDPPVSSTPGGECGRRGGEVE